MTPRVKRAPAEEPPARPEGCAPLPKTARQSLRTGSPDQMPRGERRGGVMPLAGILARADA